MASANAWTRDELLVAFNLYCQIPFGMMHASNAEIIRYSRLIGRTPGSLAMKLSNIASLDPVVTSTGRRGLPNVSKADKLMWVEMQADWGRFALQSQIAIDNLETPNAKATHIREAAQGFEYETDYTGHNRKVETIARIDQQFFRDAVFSAHNMRCCITGLAVEALLVASHIVPWSIREDIRLDPRNGLCLSALHDRAFDRGVITLSSDLTVQVSRKHDTHDDEFFSTGILAFDGKPIIAPEKFSPNEEYLSYHRQHIFKT